MVTITTRPAASLAGLVPSGHAEVATKNKSTEGARLGTSNVGGSKHQDKIYCSTNDGTITWNSCLNREPKRMAFLNIFQGTEVQYDQSEVLMMCT